MEAILIFLGIVYLSVFPGSKRVRLATGEGLINANCAWDRQSPRRRRQGQAGGRAPDWQFWCSALVFEANREIGGPGKELRAQTGLVDTSLAGRFAPSQRNGADLDAPVNRPRDVIKHRQRMPFTVCVFEPADDRRGGSHQLREFRLRKARLRAQFEVPVSGEPLFRFDKLKALRLPKGVRANPCNPLSPW